MISALIAGCGSDLSDATDGGGVIPDQHDARATDGGVGPAGALALNDVSILVPLPADEGDRPHRLWLRPGPGEQGPFFPAVSDPLPPLNADLPESLGYPAAMVTAIRFDPCFRQPDGGCQAQLRLGAQPVLTGADGISLLDDAAAHLFYRLSSDEADEVIAALVALRAASPVSTDGPLAVHPGLAADGDGALFAQLATLVLEHCRNDNLIRITTNSFAFDNWFFARFDRDGDDLVRRPIAGLVVAGDAQTWLRQAFVEGLDNPNGTIDPAATDSIQYLVTFASYQDGAPLDAAQATAAAARILALENPTLTHPDEVDCVSCHLATQARLFARRNGVDFDLAEAYVPPPGIDTSLEIVPSIDGNLGNTVAFGWHTAHKGAPVPSLSQRVVNDSAEVVAALAAR